MKEKIKQTLDLNTKCKNHHYSHDRLRNYLLSSQTPSPDRPTELAFTYTDSLSVAAVSVQKHTIKCILQSIVYLMKQRKNTAALV